jgi:hypothetical protein
LIASIILGATAAATTIIIQRVFADSGHSHCSSTQFGSSFHDMLFGPDNNEFGTAIKEECKRI